MIEGVEFYGGCVYRQADEDYQYFILTAPNFFDAERKMKEEAKHWESIGYKYQYVNHINKSDIEKKAVCIS